MKLTNLDVTLTLPGGGVSAIVGPSGAGKTTLLRAVAGLERAVRGRVEVNGSVWHDDLRGIRLPVYQRSLGFVFQDPSLFAHLSVQQNVEFGLRRATKGGHKSEEKKITVAQANELFGIESLLKRAPQTLSGGEKQRVSIARALAGNPALLLMDEPLAALDDLARAHILTGLQQLHREFAIPVLYVSHAIDEVARLADHVVVLDRGKIKASGSVFELIIDGDLALANGDNACALIEAKIVAHDEQYQLSQIAFSGGAMWLPLSRSKVGSVVRLRIQARDVSLCLNPQSGTSILNTLAVAVIGIRKDTAGSAMIELDANGARLLARITRKSCDHLDLIPGMALYAQVKSVAILE